MVSEYRDIPNDLRTVPLTFFVGVTTAIGNVGGTSIFCNALIGASDRGMVNALVILHPYTPTLIQRADSVLFDTLTGEITVATAFDAQVIAGIPFALVSFPPMTAELVDLTATVNLIFALTNSMLTLQNTDGTITLDGAEQVLYQVAAPMGVFEPVKVMVDLTNMTAAETIILRTYYRITAGGAMVLKDQVQIAGVQALPLKNIELEPNRDGLQVTCQRMAGGNIDIVWAAFYRG